MVKCLLILIVLAVVIGSIVLYAYTFVFTAKQATLSALGEAEYLITEVPQTDGSEKRCWDFHLKYNVTFAGYGCTDEDGKSDSAPCVAVSREADGIFMWYNPTLNKLFDSDQACTK